MASSPKQRITVKISGKNYGMNVAPADEEKYRRAAQEVNTLISSYRSNFAAQPEDYLAMAAIQLAVDKVGLEMDRSLNDQLGEIEQIGDQIDAYFNDVKL